MNDATMSDGSMTTDASSADGSVSMDGSIFDAGGTDGSVSEDSSISPDTGTVDAGATISGTYFAGAYHTCHVRPTGDVACWGRNISSESGGSSFSDYSATSHVIGSLSLVQTMAGGGGYSCAVTASGAVKCWGENTFRELGDGSTMERSSAVTVSGVSSVAQVDVAPLVGTDVFLAGAHHSCAVQTDGDAYCWGDNSEAQLGDGTSIPRTSAVAADSASTFSSVAVGNAHTCGLRTDGVVRCWGDNAQYERGSSSTLLGDSANSVSLGDTITQIAAGSEFTCALREDSAIQCWGRANLGQLGHSYVGSAPARDTPQSVDGISDAVSICAGADFACALQGSGTVRCWGRNDRGQLGDGTTTNQETPQVVDGIDNATSVICGDAHACATREDNTIYCWGDDTFAQLGTGSAQSSPQTSAIECDNE